MHVLQAQRILENGVLAEIFSEIRAVPFDKLRQVTSVHELHCHVEFVIACVPEKPVEVYKLVTAQM